MSGSRAASASFTVSAALARGCLGATARHMGSRVNSSNRNPRNKAGSQTHDEGHLQRALSRNPASISSVERSCNFTRTPGDRA
jgi:hypothetical protein